MLFDLRNGRQQKASAVKYGHIFCNADTNSSTMNVFLSDSTTTGSSTIGVTLGQFSSNNMNGISLANDNLQTAANAQVALDDINNAISQVSALRGNIGASVNRLQLPATW